MIMEKAYSLEGSEIASSSSTCMSLLAASVLSALEAAVPLLSPLGFVFLKGVVDPGKFCSR